MGGFHGPVFLPDDVDGLFAIFAPRKFYQMSTRLGWVEEEVRFAKCPRHENGANHSFP